MVVAQIIDSLVPGGAEVVAVNLANALAEESGIESHIIVTRKDGELRTRIIEKVKIFYLGKTKKIDFQALLRLFRYLKMHRVNIVHAHSSSYLYPVFLKPLLHFKLVWHDHHGLTLLLNGKREYPYRSFSSSYDFVFCVSQSLVDNNVKFLKTPKSQIQLLPNFSENQEIKPEHVIERPKSGKMIVMCANIRPQKDHANLISALKIVSGYLPDITTYCVGGISDQQYLLSLQEMVSIQGLAGKVIFVGSHPNPYAYFSQADVAVLSSQSEGLPLTLIEYGLAGCPTICTDVGQAKDVVNNDKGWLIPPQNSMALANAIVEALTDKMLSLEKAKKLKIHVNEHFSKEAIVKRIVLVYKNLITS